MVIVSDILLPKNADGILKVSDVSTSEGGDLSARTDITDPNTSTFVKTDADGRLNILESNLEGVGANNSLNATQYAVKQIGAFDGSAFRSVKCSNVGRLEVDINSGGGSSSTLIKGNDGNDGSGSDRTIRCDSNGKLQTHDAGTDAHLVNLNNKISKGQGVIGVAGELQQVLMYGRHYDGTLHPLETTANDRLIVDVAELTNVGQITTSSSLPAMQIAGFNTSDSRFKTLKCNVDGVLSVRLESVTEKEQVDIFSVGASIGASSSLTSSSLELKGHGKAHIFIKTGSTNQSGTYQLSGDGVYFYTPLTGGYLTPVGTPNPVGTPILDILEAEVETGARYIRVIYTNTGGSGVNVITSSKLTYS